MMPDVTPMALATLDPGFQPLKAYIIAATGLAYYADKEDALAERILRRFVHCKITDCTTYLNLLSRSDSKSAIELDALTGELTIGETYFFRYPEQFEALRTKILPECLERNRQHRRLRIWSAGCATGAEPYSVAILIKELLGSQLSSWTVTLIATDINRDFLTVAQQGCYSNWALRALSEEQIAAYFVIERSSWRLREEFREMVTFLYHNLITLRAGIGATDGMSGFDLILCRNVLIYFNREAIQTLLPHLAERLVDDGWLLVGHSEPNEDFGRVFQTVSAPGTTLYRKGTPNILFSDLSSLFSSTNESIAPVVDLPNFPPLPSFVPSSPIPTPAPRLPSVLDTQSRVLPRLRRTNERITKTAGEEASTDVSLTTVITLANRGAWNEARRACNQLLKSEIRNPAAHYYSALIDYHLSNLDKAEQSCRKAIYLDRTFVMAHFQLGTILSERGDEVGTRKAFDNTLRVLRGLTDDAILPEGDGLNAAGLRNLVQLHLKGRVPSS
ncbi:chemotaxis protein methyltransferase CheR [Gammaproteobacteria bacterium]